MVYRRNYCIYSSCTDLKWEPFLLHGGLSQKVVNVMGLEYMDLLINLLLIILKRQLGYNKRYWGELFK